MNQLAESLWVVDNVNELELGITFTFEKWFLDPIDKFSEIKDQLWKRRWSKIKIKNGSDILFSITGLLSEGVELTFYRDWVDWPKKIEDDLNVQLAYEWITEEDILDALKINLTEPFFVREGEFSTDQQVNEILKEEK